MFSCSWNKYDFFNAGLIFTLEVFIRCKKICGLGSKGPTLWILIYLLKVYSDITYHIDRGDIILNRSNNSVFLHVKIYWNWQAFDLIRACFENLNETQNTSSPGFFLTNLISIFQSINMGVDHKSPLQLFLVGFCLFCSKIGKRQV